MTEITDTHRRASLRGRESVARWRIESGVWSGRLFSVLYAVLSILPLLRREGPDWVGAIAMAIVTAGLLLATQRMKHGSRVAGCILLTLFILAKLSAWLIGGQPLWHGLFWTIVIAGGLMNGVWGTFALAAVRRDAVDVPPAPARSAPSRPAAN